MTPSGTLSESRAAPGRSCDSWEGSHKCSKSCYSHRQFLAGGIKGSRRYLWGLFVLPLAAACPTKPAAIEVSPRPVKIFGLQRIQRLTGRLVDKKGRPLAAGGLQWSSSKSDVVTVDGSGKPQAKGAGTAGGAASFG